MLGSVFEVRDIRLVWEGKDTLWISDSSDVAVGMHCHLIGLDLLVLWVVGGVVVSALTSGRCECEDGGGTTLALPQVFLVEVIVERQPPLTDDGLGYWCPVPEGLWNEEEQKEATEATKDCYDPRHGC